ncbi:MAG: hypothetical protein CXB60_10150 [Spiroplasma poulsonii]|nr:hypothetical protein [Spiroplasma poulsonii]
MNIYQPSFFNKVRHTFLLKPDTFESLIFYYYNNRDYIFAPKGFFKNFKLIGSKSMAWRVFEVLPKNFSEINNFWQNSGKRSTIEIKVVEKNWGSWENNDYVIESINIKNDEKENKYLKKLWNDFNGDLSKEYIDLGIIEDENDNFILNKLKEKYPNLNTSYFEVFEKKDYSFFDKSFSTKFKIKSNNELIYPIQTLNYKFTFITKKWLNEDLPKLIDNENLIQNWKSNFINWQNETNRQINKDLPKYGNNEIGKALKRTWKGNNINELNNKLLSLNHILETIDSKFKLNELYSKVQNLEKDINELKSQINKLNQKYLKFKIL